MSSAGRWHSWRGQAGRPDERDEYGDQSRGPSRGVVGRACVERGAGRRRCHQAAPFAKRGAEATAPDHPAHEFFSHWQEKGVRELADRLRSGAESGELKAGLDHENIARECAALDAGLRLQWLAGGRSFDLIAVMRSHLDRLMSAISADGEGL
ncbi:hypothetical protein DWB77_01928 [Streptomyces hundungensis]|uniref:BetI-type transcriptional repressor C-terminal domain-containing protein n=2 Tax=Streptomyces hundungensis TaxID=1077946 RepID=A0A387HFW4_9ACTN|nr:hypothetical protein DWB77_01928 [Streptomyces hundungensis]